MRKSVITIAALFLLLLVGCEKEQQQPTIQTCMEIYEPYFNSIAILYTDGKIDSTTYRTISDQYMKEFIECKKSEK